MTTLDIRRLGTGERQDYRTIRLRALQQEPDAFGSTYEAEAGQPLAAFADRLATSVVFGAYLDGTLVGMAAFRQGNGHRERHKAFVWGMYVDAEARGLKVGAALIEALFENAAREVEQLTLKVVAGNEAAMALYRRFGFESYGVEPNALKTPAGYRDEILMVRFLTPG